MTIQEAIESGRPYRRRAEGLTHEWIAFLGGLTGRIHWFGSELVSEVGLNPNDILATDWEIKNGEEESK